MPIKTENWDSVTPPAFPAGWGFDAGLSTTSTFLAGITPTSSPNTVKKSAVGAVHTFATWQTADGNGGNVAVQASFNGSATTDIFQYGLFARCNVNTAILASSTFYWWVLDAIGLTTKLIKVVAGVQTSLSTVSLGAWAEPGWYTTTLTLAGSLLTVALQRVSDGFWLTSSATFQAGATNVHSVSDSSITGSGFAGLSLRCRTDENYSDDWSLSAITPQVMTPYPKIAKRLIKKEIFSQVYG